MTVGARLPQGPPTAAERVMCAGRALGTATVLLHHAVAEQVGLTRTEQRAVRLIDEFGPFTASELAVRSGLSAAAVTGLVDRLERKGLARRRPHPTDRRRVLVEATPNRIRPLLALLSGWADSLAGLCDRYTEPELETVLQFLTHAARTQQALARELTSR